MGYALWAVLVIILLGGQRLLGARREHVRNREATPHS